jgi:flagellar biosynthetic protein FliR
MQSSAAIAPAILFGFLLTLARVSGVVAFLPLPGIRNSPDMTRVSLALSMTICLAPVWPAPPAANPGMITITMWMISEATFGILLGLLVSTIVEAFQLAAQVLGFQAGFSYASAIDPGSQADSTVLQIFAQLLAASLFFALGLHRDILRLLGKSFSLIPPGTYIVKPGTTEAVIDFTATIFSTGLRIAFPVVALLLLVDIALALLSRMQTQLQLITVAFPAKMLAGVTFFAVTLWVAPSLMESTFRRALDTMARLLSR